MTAPAQALDLPDPTQESGRLTLPEILYAISCYDQDGAELLLLVGSGGLTSVPPTTANKNYLHKMGIPIYSAGKPPKPRPPGGSIPPL